MPFFFDPHFEARMRPIAGLAGSAAAHERVARRDGANIHAFDGTYGDYLPGKVSKVFPERRREVL
jgi:polar amino acid transport system ATP-binding protein